jgi:hypothetical protein
MPAIYTKTEHGGWSPKGKKQEKGKIIPKKYHLKEMPTADYLKRNEANVVDSDATLILTYGPLRVLFGIQENESTFGMPRHVNRSRKGLPAKK